MGETTSSHPTHTAFPAHDVNAQMSIQMTLMQVQQLSFQLQQMSSQILHIESTINNRLGVIENKFLQDTSLADRIFNLEKSMQVKIQPTSTINPIDVNLQIPALLHEVRLNQQELRNMHFRLQQNTNTSMALPHNSGFRAPHPAPHMIAPTQDHHHLTEMIQGIQDKNNQE